ncbi:MAG: SDR family oxidoreductase [Limisphaerales bacterium]
MNTAGAKPLVWVTGAAGLIGHELVQLVPAMVPEFEVVGLTRRDLDLTDFAEVKRLFAQSQPQAVIHCAAMSRSPECQAQPKLAYLTNVDATAHLAELSKDIPFFFFSTDLVFDGKKGNYEEGDKPNPLSVYAETKVAAEKVVLENLNHTVIRTSLNAGKSLARDRSFVEEMLNAWREGKSLKLFVDEYRSPIAAEITAKAVWELFRNKGAGLFHLAGCERLSRYQIGEILSSQFLELHPKFEAASLRDYKGAPRSPDTSLNCDKLQKILSFPLPRFSDWVEANSSKLK